MPPRIWPLPRSISAALRPPRATSSSSSTHQPEHLVGLAGLAAGVHAELAGVGCSAARTSRPSRPGRAPRGCAGTAANSSRRRAPPTARRRAKRRGSWRDSPCMPSTMLACSVSSAEHRDRTGRGRRSPACGAGASARRTARRAGRRTRARTCRTHLGVLDVAGHRHHHLRRPVAAPVVPGTWARVSAPIDRRVPRIGRPSGVSPNSAVANSSWTRSVGSSSRIAISSSTTLRSTSTSCAVTVAFSTTSATMSIASAAGRGRAPSRRSRCAPSR